MTDNDDPDPPRGNPFSVGGLRTDDPGDAGVRSARENAGGRADAGEGSVRIAPTDPEVPTAKRRSTLRHQRSMVGVTAVVMGLLSITLALLYRASQRVHTADDGFGFSPQTSSSGDGQSRSLDHIHESVRSGMGSPAAAKSGAELGDEAPSVNTSDSAAASSASRPPKPSPSAHDIIRTPAF